MTDSVRLVFGHWNMVRQDLVPTGKLLEGDSIAICCAHGDTVVYPLARVEVEVDGQTHVVEAVVSKTLPISKHRWMVQGQPLLCQSIPVHQSYPDYPCTIHGWLRASHPCVKVSLYTKFTLTFPVLSIDGSGPNTEIYSTSSVQIEESDSRLSPDSYGVLFVSKLGKTCRFVIFTGFINVCLNI